MGVKKDTFLRDLKMMNTIVKKDKSDGKPWKYYNTKRSEGTFQATRKAGKRITNCFGGVAFGLLYSDLVPASALRWYGCKGGIHFLDEKAEKEFKKYFTVVDAKGKTVAKAIKDGTLSPLDICTYMSMSHTNVYLGNNKSFDAGHAYCEGNGEGAIYDKWIGTTHYQNYKLAKIVRLKDEVTPSKKRKFVGKVVKDCTVRTGPGTKYDTFTEYPSLKVSNLIDVCDEATNAANNKWYFVRIAGKYYAWVLAKRVTKA